MKNIVFMGTGPFALEILKALHGEYSEKCSITVFTKEDKPQGRGMKTVIGQVEKFATENSLAVKKPHTLKKEVYFDEFVSLDPDLVVVASYGLLLPKYVIDYPKFGCINVHGSLLPKWRGAAPINRAIISGDEKTGVTIMKMDEGLDTGDMISKAELPILSEDTAGDVFDKLAALSCPLLIKTLHDIENGTAKYKKQNDAEMTYAEKITPELRKIQWNRTSKEIHDLIRGLSPKPNAVTVLEKNGLSFKILSAKLSDKKIDGSIGTVRLGKKEIFVKTLDGALELLLIQPEGKPKMTAQDIINGRKIANGDRFI